MADFPQPITRLIELMRNLPGVGPKTAERYAYALLELPEEVVSSLGQAITALQKSLTLCLICGNRDATSPCRYCADRSREADKLAIVAQANDIVPIERSGAFHGRYHVLGNALNPFTQQELHEAVLAKLDQRIAQEATRELILALNATVEGEATAELLARRYRGRVPQISALARGLPSGSELNFADDQTLRAAFDDRRKINET